MENKYNELEKLNMLKANGTITEAEFEVEKHKILNSKSSKVHTKKNKSKLFFILFGIFLIITVVCIILMIMQQTDTSVDISDELELESYKTMAEMTNSSVRYQEYMNKVNEIQEKLDREKALSSIIFYSPFVVGGITIILLVLAIVFKIKEKGGIKIVD